jgi:mono/diheme cytochrome c family protein
MTAFIRRLIAASVLIASSTLADETAAVSGKQIFELWCTACHGAGPDKPGTGALEFKYKGAVPAELEQRVDLSADLVKYFVRHGVSVMPPFRKTEITDAELDALARYLAKQ